MRFDVSGPAGDRSVRAVIDTGFDGSLSLPPSQIRTLGLTEAAEKMVELADGRVELIRTYDATLWWEGTPRAITVDEAPIDPLLGTALLWGYDLRIRYAEGGRIEIEAV